MLPILFVFLQFSHAYLGLLTEGSILPEDKFRAGAELQGVLNENDGINLAGHFDMGLNESTELLLEAGTGAQDFFGSLQFKYVPFPDFEKQPAIGFIFGTTLASESGDSDTLLNLKAFVSKGFETDMGYVTPYTALAVNLALTDNNDNDPLQLILGSKYKHPNWENTYLFAELGVDVSDAFNYIAVYLTYEFDRGTNPFTQASEY
ncbi:MAG: hypothetical protein KDD37_06435 [Bdellovibrionales bacterium]|nr:hypothetical protein [Bdellovibrionales bacterium]